MSAVAGSATGPAAMAYINRLFEPHERVRPMGLWSFVTAGAPVIGVVMGGPLVDSIGWRMIFIIQAPILLGAALLAWNLLPQTKRELNVKFDIWGSVTLGFGATLFLLAINRGHSWGWSSPAIIGTLIASIVAFYAFVRVEQAAEAPLLPLSWLKQGNLILPMIIQMLLNFAYMGGFIVVPQMLENGLGMTAAHIGLLVISRPLLFSITAPLGSFFTMRFGEKASAAIGSILMASSMILLSTVRGGAGDLIVIIGLGASGIGFGIAGPALGALVSNSAPEDAIGVAGAMQQLLGQMGAVLGSTVMISVHEMLSGMSTVESYAYALLAGAVTSFGALALSFKLRSTDRSLIRDSVA
jgi:predicted MFS family arabinose efflux permease